MKLKSIWLLLLLFLGGCGIRGYKFASHGPNCSDKKDPRCASDAGDITHASEPGARVVVPKHARQ